MATAFEECMYQAHVQLVFLELTCFRRTITASLSSEDKQKQNMHANLLNKTGMVNKEVPKTKLFQWTTTHVVSQTEKTFHPINIPSFHPSLVPSCSTAPSFSASDGKLGGWRPGNKAIPHPRQSSPLLLTPTELDTVLHSNNTSLVPRPHPPMLQNKI